MRRRTEFSGFDAESGNGYQSLLLSVSKVGSDRSAVFYYSESSRPVAEQLALFLKSITGQEFVVRRGAGLGVEPSRKDVMLFVHYIKK